MKMKCKTDPQKIQELYDREEIRDCLYRYCRGVDRADETAIRSAYWPDAIDNHGFYNGPVEGFFEVARKVWAAGARNIHAVTNILIEFKGPHLAVVESYFNGLQRGPNRDGDTTQVLLVGRYADVFEKRGEEWRIIERNVVFDWVDDQPLPALSEAEHFGPRRPRGGSFPQDQIYLTLEKYSSQV